MAWLTNRLAAANKTLAQQSAARQELAAIDHLIESGDPDSLRSAAQKLFGICATTDPVLSQSAAGRLKTIADRDPAVLLDGLADPRLATRIQAANALRLKLGDSFDIDPWSHAPSREKKILAWRQELAARRR